MLAVLDRQEPTEHRDPQSRAFKCAPQHRGHAPIKAAREIRSDRSDRTEKKNIPIVASGPRSGSKEALIPTASKPVRRTNCKHGTGRLRDFETPNRRFSHSTARKDSTNRDSRRDPSNIFRKSAPTEKKESGAATGTAFSNKIGTTRSRWQKPKHRSGRAWSKDRSVCRCAGEDPYREPPSPTTG